MKDTKTFNLGRRSFLQTTAALAAATTVGDVLIRALPVSAATYDGENVPDTEDATYKYVFSVCQNCHGRCGIVGKVKVTSTGHELVKIEGNPYHPQNLEEDERPKYTDDVFTTINGVKYLTKPGRLCPKGQAGMQVVYNPYRIKHPLKRTGKRGSGKWKTISWNDAFTEIAAKMKSFVTPWDSRLTTPIISSDTKLTVGTIANQVICSPGRAPGSDENFLLRVFQHAIGTKNDKVDHTSICEVSHHIANYLTTQNNNTLVQGRGTHYKPDIENSRFLIFLGANPMEANFAMVPLARKIVDFKKKGGKLAVVDPRFTKTAAKADYWVPVKPGTDGAFCLGLSRYLIDNTKYDAKFLTNCNAADAAADLEKTFTDAAFLVVTDPGASTVANIKGLFLTPDAIGGSAKGATAGGTGYYCYYNGTTAVEVGSAVTTNVQLEAKDISITDKNGATVKCSTVFSLIKENVQSKTSQQYADICGIDASLFTTIGAEFAAAGKKACANSYRGTVQHTNGLKSQLCVNLLNMLVGNYDWKGGNSFGSGSYSTSKSATGTLEPTTPTGTVSSSVKGVRIDRARLAKHADCAGALNESLGNPKRAWNPLAHYGLYQEIVPSIYDQYPYPCKVLFTYWNALPYSTPACRELWEKTLADNDTGDADTMTSSAKVPLYVAIDPEIGEASAWADYILPDTTYLERFCFPSGSPMMTKMTPLRQPMVGTWDNETNFVDFADRYAGNPSAENNYYSWMATKANTDDSVAAKSWPKMLEDIFVGLAKALGGLPGFGSSFAADSNGRTTIHNAWDYAKPLIENLSLNNKTSIPAATVDNILRKGGLFASPGTSYTDFAGTATDGDYLLSQNKNLLHLYIEQLVTFTDSLINRPYAYDKDGNFEYPIARYEPIKGSKGTLIDDSAAYPYQLITYKLVEHGQARTVHCPFLTDLVDENGLDISTTDAKVLGIKTGDYVKVTSPNATYTGPDGTQKVKAVVKEGLRPGVVAFAHHFGHWEVSSRASQTIDSATAGYDSRRGKGIQLNLIMRTDPDVTAAPVSLGDKLGGSVAFHDTRVKVEKI